MAGVLSVSGREAGRQEGRDMKRGRAAARARRRITAFALAFSVLSAAIAPVSPGSAGVARAEEGWGTIVHSSDGVLLRSEPGFGAEVRRRSYTGVSQFDFVRLRLGEGDEFTDGLGRQCVGADE